MKLRLLIDILDYSFYREENRKVIASAGSIAIIESKFGVDYVCYLAENKNTKFIAYNGTFELLGGEKVNKFDIKDFTYDTITEDLYYNGKIINTSSVKTFMCKSLSQIIYEVVTGKKPESNLYCYHHRVVFSKLQTTPEFIRRDRNRELPKGVSYHTRYSYFQSHIKFKDSKLLFLGNFHTIKEAKDAYLWCVQNNVGKRFTGRLAGKILYKGSD